MLANNKSDEGSQTVALVRVSCVDERPFLTPYDIARSIVQASCQGEKIVELQAPSQSEYWRLWTHHGIGGIVDAGIETLGYDLAFRTNRTSDGRYYLLRRRAIEPAR